MGRLSLYFFSLRRRRNRRNKHKHHLLQINQQTHIHTNTRRRRRLRLLTSVTTMDDDDERRVTKKMKLDDIDLKRIIDADDEDSQPPRELEVVSGTKRNGVDVNVNVDTDLIGVRDEFRVKSDIELEDMIRRGKDHLITLNLPDNGSKLKLCIKRMEAEVERRKRDKDAHMCRNEPQLKSLSLSGAAAGLHQDTPLSNRKNHSKFFSVFSARLEQSDSRENGSCNQLKRISTEQLRSKGDQTSRNKPFQCPTSLASDKTNCTLVNSERRGNTSGSLLSQRSLPSRLIQKAAAPPNLNTVGARRRQERTVVLLDDEDSERDDDDDSPLDDNLHFDDMKRHFSFESSKVSYPSRNDPTHVDIDFSDLECLDPEVYLSSPIMNFYIRYLQQPGAPMAKPRSDIHFFNTFFYSKLKAALTDMGNDSTCFAKFRRWWKGINLFHKAYILIPVHEDHHWSLIIICIPYKDKENGPIILHLDSLGLHNSQPIFRNIKRFIGEEWDYWTHEGSSSNLPWEKLPRRLEEKTVTVPQQKNEYDCGLFVLYFMERFIAEAPDRLSRRDLHINMFSRQWFKPAEASALRTKIRRLLVKEFETAQDLQKHETSSKQT